MNQLIAINNVAVATETNRYSFDSFILNLLGHTNVIGTLSQNYTATKQGQRNIPLRAIFGPWASFYYRDRC